LEWGEKKSICNKFLQHSAITALVWPSNRHNELVFSLSEGKVKVGALKTNKASTLYAHPDGAYCVSLAASPDGGSVCRHRPEPQTLNPTPRTLNPKA